MRYETSNVFYKIIHKEINSELVYEDEHFIAIHDISPKAPVHILIISKGEYTDMYDFSARATDSEMIGLNKAIAKIVDLMHLKDGGFKLVANTGKFAMQEVMHFHVHVMGKPSE